MPGVIILWWASELRLADGAGRVRGRTLAETDDPAAAIAGLAEEAGGSGREMRIVYQPDQPETHEIAGAEGSRRALRRRLKGEFSALAVPTAVWAVDAAPRGRDGTGGGMLQLDRSERLPAAVAALARRGWKVRGAWTLTALLEAASDRSRPGAVCLVATARRSLLTSVSPEGGRWIRTHDGADFLDGTLASWRGALARFDEREPPGGIVVIEDGPAADTLRAAAQSLGPAASSLGDLLAAADRLVSGDPSDFLPAPRWRDRPAARWGLAAGLGLAGLSLLLAHGAVRRRRDEARREVAADRARRRLRDADAAAGAARRRTAAQEAEALDRPAPPAEKLLLAVARELPPTAVLHRLLIEGEDFVLSGEDQAPEAVRPENGRRFRSALASAENPWRIEEPGDGGRAPGPDFILHGRFRLTPSADSPAQNETDRLAALLARLPLSADFLPIWRDWSRFWTVQSAPGERFPGCEIRRYRLSASQPALDAWPRILATVGALCRQPGLSIERLALAAGSGESFAEAEIAVAVCLRD